MWRLCLSVFFVASVMHTIRCDDLAHMDIFHLGDANNDTSLDQQECVAMWKTFDADKDDAISKLEFEFRWTFLNLDVGHHIPLYFRLMDVDLDSYIDADEMKKMCVFFDDDDSGRIVPFEFDYNWRGLFSIKF